MPPSKTPAAATQNGRRKPSGGKSLRGSGDATEDPKGSEEDPERTDRVATVTAVALRDGRRVSVDCWPGDGAPLVLLHGLLDCAVGWKHLAAVMHRPCFAVDLPGFGDSDSPTRNRISAYVEDVQSALAALDVHNFTLVGHSLGGAVATGLAERLRDDVAALVLMAPTGFGRIHLAEMIQLPGVRTLVRHALPMALANPVTAFGVYMAVVGNGHLPDPELAQRLRKNAFRWAPGAKCANEAITASGLSRRAFYRRQVKYSGPVVALWGDRDRLVPLAHRDGVMTAFPQAQVSVWKKMGHHPQRERPSELAQFVEAACSCSRPSERTTGRESQRARMLAVRSTPQPLAADGEDLSAVA
jgi:pimeloyl-ACP methyl ester carboxylesterase